MRRLIGHPADLWRLTAADFILRAAYQVGKTPLLPIYAAMLGASDALIGAVVSVSTLTGLAMKPLFGLLSDRLGRRIWLMIAFAVFAGAPFLYQFVDSPEDLFAMRLAHGLATAILGPVGLAAAMSLGKARRAERIGLFGMARSGGYLLAPVIGAALLTIWPPEQVFTLIGFASLAAFIPLVTLSPAVEAGAPPRAAFGETIRAAFGAIRRSRAFWLVAALEGVSHAATYALKAFLPIYALTAGGYDLLMVGLFFTVQEAAHMAMRPFGGRLADRAGPGVAILGGLSLLSAALIALGALGPAAPLLAIAPAVGAAMGLILPATLSMMADDLGGAHLGAGMGALGALRNLGKVVGPAGAGLVLAATDHQGLFLLAGGMIAATALVFALGARLSGQRV